MVINREVDYHNFLYDKLNEFFEKGDYKISWNGKQFSEYIDQGWKFCSKCRYIVNTDVLFCPLCGRRYRLRKRTVSKWIFSEPKKDG